MANPFDQFDAPAAPATPAAASATQPNEFDQFDQNPNANSFGTLTAAAPYGATDALAHGTTFGLSDVAGALGTATGRFLRGNGFDYSKATHEIQAGRQAYAASHPWMNAALNLLGGFGSLGPTMGAGGPIMAPATMRAPSAVGQVLRGVTTGAGIGAVGGAADNSESAPSAAMGALHGAEYGAPLGAAMPLALRGVPAITSAIQNATNPSENALPTAIGQLRDAIGSGQRGGGPSTADIASRLVPGSGLTIGDVGGPAITRQLGVLQRSNTPASTLIENALNQRDAGAGTRLANATDYLGAGRGPSNFLAADALNQQAKTAAAPLYGKAYLAPPLNPDLIASGGELDKLMSRPSMPKAANRALMIAKEEDRDPASLGITFNPAGDPVFERVPSWQTLDYLKRGLDDVLNQYRDSTTGKLNLDEHGRAILNTRNQFLSLVDRENPDYAAARAAYSGPQQSRGALLQGAQFLNKDPDQIRAELADLSPGDVPFYQLGAQNALKTKFATTASGGNEANAIIGNEQRQNQIRAVFPNADRLLDTARNENTMFGTKYSVLGNSATAGRMAADNTGNGESIVWPVTSALMAGKPLAAGGAIAMKAVAPLLARAQGQTPEAMTELAHILTTSNPAAQQAYLNMLAPMPRQPAPYLAPTSGLLSLRGSVPPIVNGLLAPPPGLNSAQQ